MKKIEIEIQNEMHGERTNQRLNKKQMQKRKKTETPQLSKKQKAKQKKKKKEANKLIIIPLLVLIMAFLGGVYLYSNFTQEAIVLRKYFYFLDNKNYESMYDLVETDLSREDFLDKIKNIYEGIEAQNITYNVISNSKTLESNNSKKISYKISMETIAGTISFANTSEVIKNGENYKIKWSPSEIYPELGQEDKIRVKYNKFKRGSILDRNNNLIATDGTVYEIAVIPNKLDLDRIDEIADLLGIEEKNIWKKIDGRTNENTYTPLKKILKEEQQLKNSLLKIKGIAVNDVEERIYPYKEATSVMTGYVQDDTGKSGLEQAFNDTLKGEKGIEIYIEKNGEKNKTIAKKEVKDGNDVKTTIDIELQNKIYNQYQEDEGAFVSLNYNTGEVLALVSTPSYDANKFSLGMSNEDWNILQNDERKPLYNRFLSTYTPGSVFKPIIGAIGLKTGTITPEEEFEKSGRKWQKDKSWDDFWVTTLKDYEKPSNLKNALVYSDNIYFAQLAVKMGKNTLEKELNDLGFNKEIPFAQEISKSTYGKLDTEKTIANTGYGQADVQINPILLACIYSCFANGGNIVKPNLIMNDENTREYLCESAISKEISEEIKKDLIAVVEEGTAQDFKTEGKVYAGKTGTAEIKKDREDTEGTENGLFCVFDENGIVLVNIVENVKEKGGSKYTVNKAKNIFE